MTANDDNDIKNSKDEPEIGLNEHPQTQTVVESGYSKPTEAIAYVTASPAPMTQVPPGAPPGGQPQTKTIVESGYSKPTEANAYVTASPASMTQVPPGAPPGGQWVLTKYSGKKTWGVIISVAVCLVLFPLFTPCAFLGLRCACDETRAYMAPNGDLYDASGKRIGRR